MKYLTDSHLVMERLVYTFADEVKPERDKIIEAIVCQAILITECNEKRPANLIDLQARLKTHIFGHIFKEADLREYLRKLQREGILLKVGDTFRVCEDRRQAVGASLNKSMDSFVGEIGRLIGENAYLYDEYLPAFIDVLCRLFSMLGEDSANMLPGSGVKRQRSVEAAQKYLPEFIGNVVPVYPNVEKEALSSAIWTFLNNPTAEGEDIIRHMVQGYFICKALSIDSSGRLLAEDLFGQSTLYLDTNILVVALDAFYYEEHKEFHGILYHARSLGIKPVFCEISLAELKMSVQAERQKLTKSIALEKGRTGGVNVLTALRPKYEKLREENPETAFERVFEDYANPKQKLQELGLEYMDDPWFEANRETRFVQELSSKVSAFKERNNPEGELAHPKVCEHDALLLSWLQKVKKGKNKKKWLLTRDGVISDPKLDRSGVTISMGTLVQWMVTNKTSGDSDDDCIFAYADLVKHRVFPAAPILNQNEISQLRLLGFKIYSLPAQALTHAIGKIRQVLTSSDSKDPTVKGKIRTILDEALKFTAATLMVRHEEVDRRLSEAYTRMQHIPDYDVRIAETERALRDEKEKNRAADRRANVMARIITIGCSTIAFLGTIYVASKTNLAGPYEVIIDVLGAFGVPVGVFFVAKHYSGAKFKRSSE